MNAPIGDIAFWSPFVGGFVVGALLVILFTKGINKAGYDAVRSMNVFRNNALEIVKERDEEITGLLKELETLNLQLVLYQGLVDAHKKISEKMIERLEELEPKAAAFEKAEKDRKALVAELEKKSKDVESTAEIIAANVSRLPSLQELLINAFKVTPHGAKANKPPEPPDDDDPPDASAVSISA